MNDHFDYYAIPVCNGKALTVGDCKYAFVVSEVENYTTGFRLLIVYKTFTLTILEWEGIRIG